MSELIRPMANVHPGQSDAPGGHKPGENGRVAVFVCTVCGNRFARTLDAQSKCPACLAKEKKKR